MPRQRKSLPTGPENCVVYCRVSSPKQGTPEKASLDDQERNGLARAGELGLNVVAVVKDAESAWVLDKRTKFRSVLDEALAGKFTVMVVDRMNRFTRSEDLSEYMQVMTELKKAGVRPVFADKNYEQSPTGQLMMFLDAYVSAQDQGLRRKQSLVGKRKRVRSGHPNPGSWAPYGYEWEDQHKTRLKKDSGSSSAVVERIWRYFLNDARPTLYGMAVTLNDDHVPTPREYRGITRAKNAVKSGPRWTPETVSALVKNPIYWGGENGMVTTFQWAEHNEPTQIPAYAPAYVTPAEAARVHAILATNRKHLAHRPRKREWGVLLTDGLARCGECGWALAVKPNTRPRADGSILLMYRCPQRDHHGLSACGGVSISAETLDAEVCYTLDDNLRRGQFLDNLFAAWDKAADADLSAVRSIQETVDQAEKAIGNLAQNLAMLPADSIGAASVRQQIKMHEEALAKARTRLQVAQAAAAQVRGNPALRDELRAWFKAWIGGFGALPLDRRQAFLRAIGARVLVWREGAHIPRAELHISLPSSMGALPPPPFGPDEDEDEWTLWLDLKRGEAEVEYLRAMNLEPPSPEEIAEFDKRRAREATMSAEEVMAEVHSTLALRKTLKRAIDLSPSGPTASDASSSSYAAPMSRP